MNTDVSDKMLSKTLATVYYTPINEPDNIKTIMVETEKDYELVKCFIVKNTKRRRNPTLGSFQSSGLSEIDVIKRIKEDFPSIKDDYIKHLFDTFTTWMYTSAKSKEKYFGLLVNHDFIFIYHFKPDKSITFKENEIEEFVKYLDSSTINWFVFLTNNEVLKEYYDVAVEKNLGLGSNEEIIYSYEKQATKGFKELVSKELTYESKGEIKIRGEYDSDTDLVVETYLGHLATLKDSLSVSIVDGKIEINGLNISIKEVQINDKKYSSEDKDLILNHIFYNSLGIAESISDFEFYLTKYEPVDVIEEKETIVIKKLLSLIGLMQIESHIKNKKIATDIYTSSKLAMANLLAGLSQQKHSMTLQEIDRLGIEFKAGKLANGEGFFDPSPEKFANKLIEKTKSKKLDLIIYLIGINEDTKDFSPVLLSRIRNEFRESVKEKIEKDGFKVNLIESLPLDEEQGVLLIVLNK